MRRTAPANAPAVQIGEPGNGGGPGWLPKKPGEFRFTVRGAGASIGGILYGCPCGCLATRGLVFSGVPSEYAQWDWNGDREKPSCTPSIGCHPKDGSARDGSGYHWHGYLKDGTFVEC